MGSIIRGNGDCDREVKNGRMESVENNDWTNV